MTLNTGRQNIKPMFTGITLMMVIFFKLCLEPLQTQYLCGLSYYSRSIGYCKAFIFAILLPGVSFAASGQILGAGDVPYYISTVYDGNEIWFVQYAQADNSMYLVDGNNAPQVLTRSDHNDWTIADVNFVTGPFLEENTTNETITPSDVNGTISIEYSGTTLFQSTTGSSHVGSLWAINQTRSTSSVKGTFSAAGVSLSSPSFSGAYGFETTGSSWVGTLTLQRSTNNGISWRPALVALVDTDFDNPAENEESGAIYRVVASNYTSGSIDYDFTITDNTNKGVVRITDVNDANTAVAVVVKELVDTNATTTWREGYWSDYRGWPKTVVFHQQRLIYGGSESYPQTIWFGKTDPDDYPNFLEGTLDTSAFTIALQGQNPIRWLKSQDYLMIGTSGSTGKYGEQGKAITPTSPNYQEQAKVGCAALMAVDASDSLLYVERGGRKIRELSYSLQYDKYLSPDLTQLAEDITDGVIKDVAFQSSPIPTLWCVMNDGNMATMTYQRDQDVGGWSKQITDGDFESVCRIPGLDYEDEIWVIVKRTIDSNELRYVEKFEPRDWGSDINDAWFVDSGLSYNGAETNDFSGLDHLIGEDVSIYADTLIEPNEVVDVNGEIVIDYAASRVLVGLPFTSKLETLPIRIDPQDSAANKKIRRVHFDLYETGYLQFGPGATSTVSTINFKNDLSVDPNATSQGFYTSIVAPKTVSWPYGTAKKQTIYLKSSQPMPLTVRSITPDYKMY